MITTVLMSIFSSPMDREVLLTGSLLDLSGEGPVNWQRELVFFRESKSL